MKNKKSIICLILCIFFVILSFINAVLIFFYSEEVWLQLSSILLGAIGVGISIPLLILNILNSRLETKEKEEVEQYYNTLRGTVRLNLSRYGDIRQFETLSNDNNSDSTQNDEELNKNNILELMLANMKEIKEYYVLSKSQAKKAFATAIIMGVLGFLLIGVSIILSVLYKENIAAAIIPAIGATIIEILSAVFLIIYNKSLEQLNHYYDELHDNEKFLSAVNLVSNISKDKQDDVYIEIIESRLTTEKCKSNPVEP